jgi:hypothetical protein
VGDAQGVGLDRDANNRIGDVFEADHIRQVATGAGGDQIEAVVGGVRPPRRQPAKDLADLVPSAPERHFGPEDGHRVLGRGNRQARSRVAVDQCLLGFDLAGELGNDDHVVVLGSARATARDGSSAEWKYTQIFHIRDGKTTEVWGMAENDAAVDPFLDGLPD